MKVFTFYFALLHSVDQIPALPISKKLIEAFKAKASLEQVEEILKQIPGPKKDDDSGEGKVKSSYLTCDMTLNHSHGQEKVFSFHCGLYESHASEKCCIF